MRLLILFLFLNVSAQSQSFAAKKGMRAVYYSVGQPLKVQLLTPEGKVIRKGLFLKASLYGFYLASFNKRDTSTIFIPANEVYSITKLHRKARKGILIGAGGGIALSGALVLATGTESLDSPLGYVLLIPAFGAAFIAFYGLPVTYLLDIVSSKSKKHGWY